ncbi:hypothetical protein BN14_08830 [Rhizoctonia solani AG-1 IB]|uniref:CHAT domain-containing protein n=1 Tax=Thanatephorus cucumeris (strain AG1-IB / isolate 7/3/14) TaxID=1108050 RepID=M5C440_THACB|nr:hypothetical protein BN14_08830 [Rhizoctonia solani AG-1 IB]
MEGLDHEGLFERGEFHHDQFLHLGNLDDIEKAIEYGNRALDMTPKEHPRMATQLTCLGAYYHDRFRQLENLDDMEKSIDFHVRALGLTDEDHPQLSFRLGNLGISHSVRFRRLGQLDDLDKSIDYKSRVIKLTPDNDPDLSNWHAALGVSYADRYQCLGELEDLEKWIESDSRALLLTPGDHPDMPERLANLGISYGIRYQRRGQLEDLDKSIDHKNRALALTPEGHPDLPDRHAALGVSYSHRYRHLGEPKDLEKWIECDFHALAFTVEGHPDLPERHTNLGVSYGVRFQRLGKLEDLDKSIDHKTYALSLTPDGHPDLLDRHADLGASYGDRYQRLGTPSDLGKTIECQSRVLALTPEGHPELSIRHFNQAMLLHDKYRRTGNRAHLDSSLGSFRKSSQLSSGAAPRDAFNNALRWAKLASKNSYLEPIEAFRTTIDLLDQFIWLKFATGERDQDLALVKTLAAQAASAATLSLEYGLALEWLEHVRCVVWNQTLMVKSPVDELVSSHIALANRLKSVSEELHLASSDNAGSHSVTASPEHRLPGFGDFLSPTKVKDLLRVARNGPVVVLNCHEDHCDALLVLPGHSRISHVALPSFTEQQARRTRSNVEAWLRRGPLQNYAARRPLLEPESDIGPVLADLWYNIVKPILSYLGYLNNPPIDELPHITWCPTGALSFLPLHAAGDYEQPQSRVFDHVVSSYTPTLAALLAYNPTEPAYVPRMLAIGQEATPGHSPLPNITQELGHIKNRTQDKVIYSQLTGDQATTTAVLDAMEQYDWIHFACHARQNISDPTRSGFYLHDDALDLAAVNQRFFKNKGLAFLSIRQTEMGDEKLPDEVIHLASGMMIAGYPSVIATMWSVMDDDAPFVTDKIYGQLMKSRKVGNGEAGRALHRAMAALREKVGEKEFRRWVPYIHIGS